MIDTDELRQIAGNTMNESFQRTRKMLTLAADEIDALRAENELLRERLRIANSVASGCDG
jgi:hypothetical protein